MRPDGPYCASFHNEPTTKSPRPSSNSSLNVAHRKRSAEVKVIPVHHGYSQHTQSCRLLIGSKLRHVRKMGHVIGSLTRHVIQRPGRVGICINSDMGDTKQTQRCYFYIQPCCSWSCNEMCCVQTNKQDWSHILCSIFFVAENIGLFFSLSIFKNFFQSVFHDKYSSNGTAGLFN